MKTFNEFINESKEITIDKEHEMINDYLLYKGDKVWVNDKGEIDREDGPAIIFADGTKWWMQKNQIHRLNGPAAEETDGTKHWRINGYSPEVWTEEEIKLLLANNKILDLVKYPEIIEKIQEYPHLLTPKHKLVLDVEWKNKI